MKQPLLSLYVHFSNSLHLSHGDFIFIIYYHLLNKYVGETKSDIGQDIEDLQTSIESQMEVIIQHQRHIQSYYRLLFQNIHLSFVLM